MNKRKQEIERRKIVNLIRASNRHRDCLKCTRNESEAHIRKKFEVYLKLLKDGWEVYSEAIFKSGKRADIIAIREGEGICVEVLESEKYSDCLEKLKNYPKQLRCMMVKTLADVERMEL